MLHLQQFKQMLTKHALHFQFKIANAKKRIPTIHTVWSQKLTYPNITILASVEIAVSWNVYSVCGLSFCWLGQVFSDCRLYCFLFCKLFCKKITLNREKKFQRKVSISFFCASGLPLGWFWQIFITLRLKLFVASFCAKNLHLTIFGGEFKQIQKHWGNFDQPWWKDAKPWNK